MKVGFRVTCRGFAGRRMAATEEGSRAGGLDLDTAAITSGPRATPVDDYLRTNVEYIFAAGDVNGRAKLVQSARLEGRIAAWNAVYGPTRQLVHDVVPSGSFTDPEYGTVGLTEDLAAHAHDITVGFAWYDVLMNVEQLAMHSPARTSLGGTAAGRHRPRGRFRLSDGFISPLNLVEIGLVSAEEARELHELETAAAANKR